VNQTEVGKIRAKRKSPTLTLFLLRTYVFICNKQAWVSLVAFFSIRQTFFFPSEKTNFRLTQSLIKSFDFFLTLTRCEGCAERDNLEVKNNANKSGKKEVNWELCLLIF
jgi:hypothetical protein